MDLGKNRGDPTARRRRSHDEVLLHAQDIVRLRDEGQSERSIARQLGLSRGSVKNVSKQFDEALEGSDDEHALAVRRSHYRVSVVL
jgi:hypothetical protein